MPSGGMPPSSARPSARERIALSDSASSRASSGCRLGLLRRLSLEALPRVSLRAQRSCPRHSPRSWQEPYSLVSLQAPARTFLQVRDLLLRSLGSSQEGSRACPAHRPFLRLERLA